MKSVIVNMPTNLRKRRFNDWSQNFSLLPLFYGVPQWCGAHSIVDQGKKRLFDKKLSVKNNQFCRGWYEVVTFMEFEKLDEDLAFILL